MLCFANVTELKKNLSLIGEKRKILNKHSIKYKIIKYHSWVSALKKQKKIWQVGI